MSSETKTKRSEERSSFNYNGARLLRQDGRLVTYVALDLSSKGLGVLCSGDLPEGEQIRIESKDHGSVDMIVVWSRQDLIREGYFHCGLRAKDEGVDLRNFFTKLMASEKVKGQKTEQEVLPESQVKEMVKNLNTDDPTLFTRMGMEKFKNTHKAYQLKFQKRDFAVLSSNKLPQMALRNGDLAKLRESIKIMSLQQNDQTKRYETSQVWPEKGSHTPKLTAMLVEDDEDLRDLLVDLIEEDGHKVVIAADGEEGIKKFKSNPEIEMVISDLKMPKQDGITMIGEINKLAKIHGRSIPSIILSGHVTKESLQKGNQVGVTKWMVKPVDYDELLRVLNEVASNHDAA